MTLCVCLKRPGARKTDGSPYLHVKGLVPVGDRSKATGWDVVEQFVDPGLDAELSAVPGVYEIRAEPRAVNGRLEQVIIGVRLVAEGFPA